MKINFNEIEQAVNKEKGAKNMNDKCDVTFKTKMSQHPHYHCDACYDIARVMKVTLQQTRCFDGKTLSAQYSEYWICDTCRTKLVHALDFPEDE